ncbi:MAG: sel1 repeat family protein [Ideonella sp.]|nr:sel1 repeat family protein [Ideonella sp.]
MCSATNARTAGGPIRGRLCSTAWRSARRVAAGDAAQGAAFLRAAAEQGLLQAQFDLGLGDLNGIGVPRNDAEAVRWFRRAGEAGFASAQHSMGLMYQDGQGVARDLEEALRWHARAAAQGHAKSASQVRAIEGAVARNRTD